MQVMKADLAAKSVPQACLEPVNHIRMDARVWNYEMAHGPQFSDVLVKGWWECGARQHDDFGIRRTHAATAGEPNALSCSGEDGEHLGLNVLPIMGTE